MKNERKMKKAGKNQWILFWFFCILNLIHEYCTVFICYICIDKLLSIFISSVPGIMHFVLKCCSSIHLIIHCPLITVSIHILMYFNSSSFSFVYWLHFNIIFVLYILSVISPSYFFLFILFRFFLILLIL